MTVCLRSDTEPIAVWGLRPSAYNSRPAVNSSDVGTIKVKQHDCLEMGFGENSMDRQNGTVASHNFFNG